MEPDTNRLNELFNIARNETSKVSFNTTKKHFLSVVNGVNSSSILQKVVREFLTLKKIIIMTLTMSTIAIGMFLLTHHSDTAINNKDITFKSYVKPNTVVMVKERKKVIKIYVEKVETKKGDLSHKIKISTQLVATSNRIKLKAINHTIIEDSTYRFPSLTDKEIKENNKLKEQFVKLNVKQQLFGYITIPAGEVNLGGQMINVDAFEMKQTEVSNQQYRVFLFDLLINDRKQDFLMAKPNQSQWLDLKNEYGKYLVKSYFSGVQFNDYPVVNISRKGAEMYCKWLTEEINKTQTKKLKGKKVMVQLPTEKEWKYSASGGKNNLYGWSVLKTRQNSRGCFLANFKYDATKDTIPFTGCQIKCTNPLTTAGLVLGKNSFTVKVTSYNANDFHLFCVSGNVAEMVQYPDGTIGAKGGSWNSTGENIKINAPDEFKGIASPNINIGFRPIMIFVK